MSWQDAAIAIAGALLVIGLGSALIREIFRTAHLVMAVNGQIRLEEAYRQSHSASAAAQRPAAKRNRVDEQGEFLMTKNGDDV